MMHYDLLSILTPFFLLKLAKTRVGATQKTKLDKGGSENDNLCQICYLIQYFIDFSAINLSY